MSKRCAFRLDTPRGVIGCEVDVADDATVATVLAAARSMLGSAMPAEAPAGIGIYGQLCGLQDIPRDGDRIEGYRALELNPRQQRRVRAAAAKPARTPRTAGRDS